MAELEHPVDVRGIAAIINSRLAAEARVAQAIGFTWLCGGAAIALSLAASGLAAALYGYSYVSSINPAAEHVAKMIANALEHAQFKSIVTGTVTLSPDSELHLAGGQTVRLRENSVVKLDPTSTVRVTGDLKMPQPSKHQLQPNAMSKSAELPFTTYTVFRSVPFGAGLIETGWEYDLSDALRPRFQYCHYRQAFDESFVGKITIANDGAPANLPATLKLPFKLSDALADCIWFSGL